MCTCVCVRVCVCVCVCVLAMLKYWIFVFTDSSGMDWSTLYANALAQMLNDKNLTTVNNSSHGDVITLPRSTVATVATQQAQVSSDTAELKQSSDHQMKNLLTQASASQHSRVQSDLLASALRSHSPSHSLTVSASAGGTSPKPHSAASQDLDTSNGSIPTLPTQSHDLQAANNLVSLSADKVGMEDNKQRLSPYHSAMVASEQQLSPNTAALAMTNLPNQKSPSRQQTTSTNVKEEVSLAGTAGTTAIPGKEDLLLMEDTKMFLKQLAQQPQKSMPGSIVIPGSASSDQQEELTIHPGGSGELVMMSHLYTYRCIQVQLCSCCCVGVL